MGLTALQEKEADLSSQSHQVIRLALLGTGENKSNQNSHPSLVGGVDIGIHFEMYFLSIDQH